MLTVIIIIGILATVSVSHYSSYRERALQNEAIAGLNTIIAAEKIQKMEKQYVGCVDTDDCNSKLYVSLNGKNWGYTVSVNPGPGNTFFTAEATRSNGDPNPCVYRFRSNQDDKPIKDKHCL